MEKSDPMHFFASLVMFGAEIHTSAHYLAAFMAQKAADGIAIHTQHTRALGMAGTAGMAGMARLALPCLLLTGVAGHGAMQL